MKLSRVLKLSKLFLPVMSVMIFSQPTEVWAWGGRGHDVICRSAIYLVKNKNLQNFLKTRPHTMGHLCNLPDTYWKTLAKEIRKQGDPAHYIDPEILGITIDKIPFDLKEISKNYNGKENQFEKDKRIFNVIDDLGSAWWRVDQFYRRISALGPQFKNSNFPKNNSEEQNQDLLYNKLVYQMMTEMGLVGHFIGDLGQPFHNTADHDGYAAGHGGIHAYYEEGIIAQFDENLETKALTAARKIKKLPFMNSETVFEKMKGLSALSVQGVK
nr:hypothetical protein [Pseudobdellovibrionaceae bacterium]